MVIIYHTKKRFGQHFLQDDEILSYIVSLASIQEHDHIWEIGPGIGNLTDHILKHKVYLTIFEIDRDLVSFLTNKYSNKCEIVEGDFLKQAINKLLSPSKLKIITNLPYQISSPFLFFLSENFEKFDCIVAMLQREVAQRITAVPGTKNFGVLTLKISFYFQIEYLLDVERTKFIPVPKVDSAIVRLTPRKIIPVIEDINFYWRIIEISFSKRRKTLKNNLKQLFNKDSYQFLIQNFKNSSCPIDLNRRGETLSEEEFIALYYYLLRSTNS